MFRFASIAVMAMLACSTPAFAQLLPNAPWNKRAQASSCPRGGCPDSQAVSSAGHWTYPGTITNHLQGAHGVPTNGMSREQMLDLHDALHEGRAPAMKQVAPAAYAEASYAAPLPALRSGGSTGSYVLKSGGSTGSSGTWSGSFGSTGTTIRIFDARGCLISTINEPSAGSTISPEIAKSATTVQGIQQLAVGDRVKFRRVLLAAAQKARDAGDITSAQYLLLSFASRSPRVLEQIQGAVHEQAIEEGLATAQAIDWDALINFIEKLIPIIIQLIDLFS